MTEKEIAEIMQMTIPELLSLCRNRATAVTVLSLAIQRGIRQGHEQVCQNYNTAMLSADFDEVLLRN